MRHHAPGGWRTSFKVTYKSMRRRAPGGLAHGFKRYIHFQCATMRQEGGACVSNTGLTNMFFYTCVLIFIFSMRRRAPEGWRMDFFTPASKRSYLRYPCATMRQGGGARILRCLTIPCAGARQGGWRMDLRIIHAFHVPPCDREVAHGC